MKFIISKFLFFLEFILFRFLTSVNRKVHQLMWVLTLRMFDFLKCHNLSLLKDQQIGQEMKRYELSGKRSSTRLNRNLY